jgi:hypothetical protein
MLHDVNIAQEDDTRRCLKTELKYRTMHSSKLPAYPTPQKPQAAAVAAAAKQPQHSSQLVQADALLPHHHQSVFPASFPASLLSASRLCSPLTAAGNC